MSDEKREEDDSNDKGSAAAVIFLDCHGRVIPTIGGEAAVTAAESSLSNEESANSSNSCLALQDRSIVYIKDDSLPLWLDTLVQTVVTQKLHFAFTLNLLAYMLHNTILISIILIDYWLWFFSSFVALLLTIMYLHFFLIL
jgi:hypothetical protein